MAFFLQRFNLLHGSTHACVIGLNTSTGVFQHHGGVQGNVWAAPRIGRRRQVVGIGLASHLKHGQGHALWNSRATRKPLCIRPALHYRFGMGIAFFGHLLNVIKVIKHQEGFLEGLGCSRCALGIG